uniref:Uncharacterized protein n=1 Tax=Anguilla anguilla TaxID=7936 RepID=A0A0E9RRV2_ANGAN
MENHKELELAQINAAKYTQELELAKMNAALKRKGAQVG